MPRSSEAADPYAETIVPYATHTAPRRSAALRCGQQVVLGLRAPLEPDRAAGGRRPAELQKATVAELLLAEVRLHPAKLVLEAGQPNLAVTVRQVCDHRP